MGIGKIVRRTLLIGSAAVAGGVAFGVWRYRADPENPLLADLPEGAASLTPFVVVDAEGVTFVAPRADVGQGAASIQAHLIAEEMDVDPHAVRIVAGPASKAYYNGEITGHGIPVAAWDDGRMGAVARLGSDVAGKLVGLNITGGSTTVPDLFERLREAGAVARETLKAAAAARLGVDVATLATEGGAVVAADGTRLPYADLAAAAAATDLVREVTLRDPSEWRVLGRAHRRTDVEAKSTGAVTYGVDVDLPGMLRATAVTNPVRGGGVASLDTAAAAAMRGIEAVIPIPDGFAVIADNDWRAMRAARAVAVEWGDVAPKPDTATLWAEHAAVIEGEETDSRFADEGDVAGAPGELVEAEYRVPFLHHAPLEPTNATVRYTPERTDLWCGTQVPTFACEAVARITGQDVEQVHLTNLPSGGSFGHRLEMEWIEQAAHAAMAVPGRPVRLTLGREQDMTHGFLRPMALARGRATHEGGRVRSFDLDVAALSVTESQMQRLGYPPVGPDLMTVQALWDAPYAIPDRRVTGYRVPASVPVSSWRSVGASFNGFFGESLLDEVILAAGADPVEERLRLLRDPASRTVLETVAGMAGWDGPGKGKGVAFTYSFGVPVAEVVEVEETDAGLALRGLWIAADLGTVLDPVNAEAQLSGGALFGLGHAMHAAVEFAEGRSLQSNFHDYASLRLWEVPPTLEVRALGLGGRISGAGEPGLPPAAPALANAIFAATGTRLREMPFDRTVRFA
ncbi:xanthine dehydrogenase family protein molybdopterin-binding subunit [Jannaschia sp. Os4]|uniref:molybdopterin cofactor-binding domain-containing protein n=1 Tax=Jannaschia sp. Os4 TaxID=2807617 RepID=UPI00193ACDDF|nr:molybdopterin cofactor-binding domain-containing protein [Jannaschia sp. Os4]MBM2576258.1 xanthine dehydrogenase family protein molybdopterin-binding subunit [Jannaschia sp. Os4]